MYSTNIEDERYPVRCICVSKYVASERFLVDMGAKYTCCNYWVIDDTLTEEQIVNHSVQYIGGLVRGRLLYFMITNPYNQKIYFCKDSADYHSNFELKEIIGE